MWKFSKNVINRASQREKVGKLPYGTATLHVSRVQFHYQMKGGIDYLSQIMGT
jgi:hypothetical protein